MATFMREDCSPQVRSLLLAAIDRCDEKEPPLRQHLEFDRFEFTLDADHGNVLIENVLDPTESGAETISVAALKAVLNGTTE